MQHGLLCDTSSLVVAKSSYSSPKACLVEGLRLELSYLWACRSWSHQFRLPPLQDCCVQKSALAFPKPMPHHQGIKQFSTSCTTLGSDDVLHMRWKMFGTHTHVLHWLQLCFYLVEHIYHEPWPHDNAPQLWSQLCSYGLEAMLSEYSFLLRDLQDAEGVNDLCVSHSCEICGQTFASLRGLRVHHSTMHAPSTPTPPPAINATLRCDGLDGMPTCSICGQRFSTWYSFDRHKSRGSCTEQVIARPLRSRSSLRMSGSTQETHEVGAPVIQRADLKQKILQNWQQALEDDSSLRKMLLHHCVVCNQWFAKNHHLTRHASAQHGDLLRQARLKRMALMDANHIKPIRWTCVFCDSCFNSANIHHCSVLLQIALLLVAWTDSPEHGIGGRGISAAHRSGDGAVQRSSSIPPSTCRERLLCGERGQETSHSVRRTEAVRCRFRLRNKSPAWTLYGKGQSRDRKATERDRCFSLPIGDKARRCSEQPTPRHLLHDVYGKQYSWSGRSPSSHGRSMEIPPHNLSHLDHRTTTTNSVSGGDRGVGSQADPSSSGSRIPEHSAGGTADGGHRPGLELCLPPMEPHQGSFGAHGQTTVASKASARDADEYDPTSRPPSSTPLPCSSSLVPEACFEGLSVSLRDRQQNIWSTEGLGDARHIVHEQRYAASGNPIASQQSTALAIGSRDSQVLGQSVEHIQDSGISILQGMLGGEQIARLCSLWLQIKFLNPTNVCYMNASFNFIGWGLLHQSLPLQSWAELGELMQNLLCHHSSDPCAVYTVALCRMMLQGWNDLHSQQDAAEFLGFILQKLRGCWTHMGSWREIDAQGQVLYTMPLTHPIAIPVILDNDSGRWRDPISLKCLIDHWSATGRLGLCSPPPDLVYLQLLRYRMVGTAVQKVTREITNLEDDVLFPLSGQNSSSSSSSHSGIDVCTIPYYVLGLVVHLGLTPSVGHYYTLLRRLTGWTEKNDSTITEHPVLTKEHSCNCYLVCLSRRHEVVRS